MSSTPFSNIADVFNAFNVGIFPMKSKPGKFYVRTVGKDGKKFFVDRREVTQPDGSKVWQWVMGREMTTQEGQQLTLTA